MTTALLGSLSSFLSALTWALGSSAYAELAKKYPPSVINLTRATFAFPLFLTMALILNGPQGFSDLHPAQVTWFALSMIGSFAVGDFLFLKSATILGVPGALAIASCFPIWAALGGWILGEEGLFWRQSVGIGVICIGIAAVILSDVSGETKKINRAQYRKGLLMAFMTSILWALNGLSVSRGGTGLPPFVIATVRMGWAILLCPLAGFVFTRKAQFRIVDRKGLSIFGWVFVLEGCLGSFLYVYGLSHTPLAIACALTSVSPILAVPIQRVFTGKKVTRTKALGIFITVLGVWLLLNKAF